MKKKIHILLFVLTICSWTGSANAASFSCEPSSALGQTQHFSIVEKLICDDPKASLLDEKVAGLFWLTRQIVSDHSNISSVQKRWLKEKRDVCRTAECVIAAYEERYREMIQRIGTRLHSLPQKSSWNFATPWQNAPNSYCVRFAEKKGTRDYIDIYLGHDGKTLCGKGDVVIDCGLRIQEISPIKGYLEEGVGWVEFGGQFGQMGDSKPSYWRGLVAYNGKKLYWKVVSKTEVESYIPLKLRLDQSKSDPSDTELQELRERCSKTVK